MKRLVPIVFATALLINSGCHIFSKKKSPAPTETKNAAADVEKEFMQRWIEKRTNDLVVQGLSPDTARAQAASEFKAQYNYTDVAQQAK
jgi:hypothetical protein